MATPNILLILIDDLGWKDLSCGGDYKLIEFFEDGSLELYNLRDDPSKKRNLAEVEPERTATLRAMLAAWREEGQAETPKPNPDYVPCLLHDPNP